MLLDDRLRHRFRIVCVASGCLLGCDPTGASSTSPVAERLASVALRAGGNGATDSPVTATAASMGTALASARTATRASDCPPHMILVEGEYCEDVQHECLRYLDPPGRYHEFRCAEYREPARCLSNERVQLRFCIDRDEYRSERAAVPENHKSFSDAMATCEARGARVCRESEWNFACEGEDMRPYPYGFERDSTACNADRTALMDPNGRLRDQRSPAGSHPRCDSPFGVRDLSGNLEEFVALDGTSPPMPAMKGAYWQPGRNHCRAKQTAHDSFYKGTETGFRCCADARDPSARPAL